MIVKKLLLPLLLYGYLLPSALQAQDNLGIDLSDSLELDLGAPLLALAEQDPSFDLDLKDKGISPAQGFAEFDQLNPSSGAYAFRIPVQVPPGRNGLVPKASLSYSSDRPKRGSLLGAGWTLDSLNCIERHGPEGQELYTGKLIFGRGTPQFDSNDTFFLNGQRLVPCPAQPQDSSCPVGTFRTEHNNFEKIEKQPSSVPQGWRVTKTDGTIVEYNQRRLVSYDPFLYQGFDQSSLFCATGVKKDGNEIRFTYSEYPRIGSNPALPSGVPYLSHIDYGGPIGGPHIWQISFSYEARPDRSIDFSAGMLVAKEYRLSSIGVLRKLGANEYRRTRLLSVAYEQSPDSNLSRVTEVREYGKTDSDYLPAYVFSYAASSTKGWESVPGGNNPDLTGENAFVDNGNWGTTPETTTGVVVADFNADGLVDVFRHRDDSQPSQVWLGAGNGRWQDDPEWVDRLIFSQVPFFELKRTTGISETFADNGVRFMDLNGDGHQDIVQAVAADCSNASSGCPTGDFYVGIWDPAFAAGFGGYNQVLGTQFKTSLSNNHIYFSQFFNTPGNYEYKEMGSGVMPMDVNADGLTDIAISRQGFGSGEFRTLRQVWLNTGSYFRCAQENNDGTCPDVFDPTKPWYFPTLIVKNADDPFTHQYNNKLAFMGVQSGDLNGDRLPDVVQALASPDFTLQHGVWINNGNGWTDYSSYYWDSLLPTLTGANQVYFNYLDVFYNGAIETAYLNFRSGASLFDLNGDGLDDLVMARCRPGAGVNPYANRICDSFAAHLNTGLGWGSNDPAWHLPVELLYSEGYNWTTDRQYDSGLRFAPVNGDGALDLIRNRQHLQIGQESFAVKNKKRIDSDLLTGVVSPYGGSTTISYKLLNTDTLHPELPYSKVVVNSITQQNGKAGAGTWSATKHYYYMGGRFDQLRREFAGFNVVSEKQPDIDGKSLFVTTWFKNSSEDFCRMGQVAHVVKSEKLCSGADGVSGDSCLYDPSTLALQTDTSVIHSLKVHEVSSNIWSQACSSSQRGPFFNPISETITKSFDPTDAGVSKSVRTSFVYYRDFGDLNFGHLYRTIEHGGLTGNLFYRDKITNYTPPNLNSWILGKPCHVVLRDGAGRLLRATANYYDGNGSYCAAPPTKGRLTRTEDFGYDKTGELDAHTWKDLSYTPAGNMFSVTDARGYVSTTYWDYAGLEEVLPRSTVNAKNQTTSYTYDDHGNLTYTILPNTVSTSLEYDGLGRLSHVYSQSAEIDARLPETWYTYLINGDPSSQKTRTLSLLDDVNNTWLTDESWLDGMGREYLTTHRGGSTEISTSKSYNARGLLHKVTVPYSTTTWSADTSRFDLNQVGTVYAFDALGRELSRTLPGGQFSNTQFKLLNGWDDTFFWQDQTDINNGIVQRRHLLSDAFGRLVKIAECSGGTCNNPLSDSDARITSYRYNAQDFQTDICMADGNGECSSELTSRTKFFYDGLGRRIGVKDANASNCLDANIDNLNSGCPARFHYDDAGNLDWQTDPSYAIDAGQGSRIDYVYDQLNRTTQKTVSHAGSQILFTYTYDTSCQGGEDRPIGQLTSETRSSAAESISYCYAYFGARRLKSKSLTVLLSGMPQSVSALFRYSYYNSGYLASAVLPSSSGIGTEVISYGLDDLGRPSSLSSSDLGSLASNVSYDAFGRETIVTVGNNTTLTHAFNNNSDQRLGNIGVVSGNSTLMNLVYGYDQSGNITSLSNPLQSETEHYSYDYLNRLTQYYQNGSLIESYNYDSLGNRSAKTVLRQSSPGGGKRGNVELANGAVSTSASPGQFSQSGPSKSLGTSSRSVQFTYHTKHGRAFSGQAGPHAPLCVGQNSSDPCLSALEQFNYSTNGNMLSHSSSNSSDSRSFAYDYNNKVNQVVFPTGQSIQYWYGPHDEKIATREQGVLTLYLDDAFELRDGVPRSYYFLNENRLATRVGTQAPVYYMSDHLRSTRLVTDSNATVVDRLDYLPFGGLRQQNGTSDLSYKFHGNETDRSGLYDYQARSYAPDIGTFLQPDPLQQAPNNPQAINRYAYVVNNPLRNRDPSGLVTEEAGSSDLEYLDPWAGLDVPPSQAASAAFLHRAAGSDGVILGKVIGRYNQDGTFEENKNGDLYAYVSTPWGIELQIIGERGLEDPGLLDPTVWVGSIGAGAAVKSGLLGARGAAVMLGENMVVVKASAEQAGAEIFKATSGRLLYNLVGGVRAPGALAATSKAYTIGTNLYWLAARALIGRQFYSTGTRMPGGQITSEFYAWEMRLLNFLNVSVKPWPPP